MRTSRAGRWGLLVGLLFLLAPPSGGADDVPDAAKKKYAEAKALYLKGDPKSLTAAFSALSEVKGKAAESADFWELFVRVWRASKKPEGDLWTKIIAPREQALPKCPVFDVVRARLETDTAKKGELLQKAIDKDPTSVPTRLLLVAHLRATGEEAKAEDMLDKVIAERPDESEALVLKTEMMVEGGLSRSAVKLATDALAKRECPALRYALALALRQLSREEAEAKPKALEAAKKAVEGHPDPAYVATLADLLDESDRTAEAVALLKTHVEKGNDPRLAGRLGAFAFRAGDYDGAIKGLAPSAPSNSKSAKALALAHARRGRPKEARAALDQLLAIDKEAAPFAASVELLLGDPAAARRRLQGRTDDASKSLLTRADVLEGKVAEVAAAVGKEAAAGTREGEDALLSLVLARLYTRITNKIQVTRSKFLDARVLATEGGLPQAKAPKQTWVEVQAKSHGLAQRTLSYLRSACGNRFQLIDQMQGTITQEGGKRTISMAFAGRAECDRDVGRSVRFNAMTFEGEVTLDRDDFSAHHELWAAAEKAFTDGCASLTADDSVKAGEHFGKALESEPGWHRAKLFRALAKAFTAGADVTTVAREALDSVAGVPDDWEAHEVAIVLGIWAGVDVSEAVKALQKHIEARSVRHLDRL